MIEIMNHEHCLPLHHIASIVASGDVVHIWRTDGYTWSLHTDGRYRVIRHGSLAWVFWDGQGLEQLLGQVKVEAERLTP